MEKLLCKGVGEEMASLTSQLLVGASELWAALFCCGFSCVQVINCKRGTLSGVFPFRDHWFGLA